ncbi:MAG: S8 family serine peptidase, partial [Tumebacillaceae bacterium]
MTELLMEQTGLYFIKFANVEQGASDLSAAGLQVVQRFALLPDVVTVSLLPAQAQEWELHPNVLYVEMDGMVSARSFASYGFEETLPALRQIQATDVQAQGFAGAGVRVAVLDTGINTQSQRVRAAGGVSFVSEEADYEDGQGHGTALAGVIGMQLSHEDSAIGVAPQAELYAVKVLN